MAEGNAAIAWKEPTSTAVDAVDGYNNVVRGFIKDLRGLFPSGDAEIAIITRALNLLTFNARAAIQAFKSHVMPHRALLKYLLTNDLANIIRFDFKSLMSHPLALRMLSKFSQAVHKHQHDTTLCNKMFDWFKLMIFYSLLDANMDPVGEISKLKAMDCGGGAEGH